MKKENQKNFCISVCMLAMFVLWTMLVCFVDVKPIGPQESSVGFSSLNKFIHNLTGVHMSLYIMTDWLSLIPLCFALWFASLGLMQWIKRRSIFKVDYSILTLGGFYIATIAAYIFFEIFPINYRPILINGCLEASYPSSTTMLVICVMSTAVMQLNSRLKSDMLRRCAAFSITVFIVFMVTLRLVSGVHWFTDIIGGIILSAGLVTMYYSAIKSRT